MAKNLKPLFKQVIFLTSAASDIGVKALHLAVEQGARVFMVDNNEEALQELQDEMRGKGYDTAYAVTNSIEEEQLQFAADRCIDTFGEIDTWVNLPSIIIGSEKKHFEIHYWEMVNGCNIAVPLLKKGGGVLINIASTYRAENYPDKHIDSASRQAVKGYTDALRKDLQSTEIPVLVSLIISSDPETVAHGILRCAEVETRQIGEGSAAVSKLVSVFAMPRDTLLRRAIGGALVTGGMVAYLLRRFRFV